MFGVQQLYYILIAVCMELVRLGFDIALLRFYVPEKDIQKKKAVFSTIFWTAIIFTTAISIVLWIGAEYWTKAVTSTTVHPEWMFYTFRQPDLLETNLTPI